MTQNTSALNSNMTDLLHSSLDLRRHQNIIAFRLENEKIFGFHSYNLQTAHVSEEAFNLMSPISVHDGSIPEKLFQNENQMNSAWSDLNLWNKSNNPLASDAHLEFGIRSITININQICNLKCHYCAAGGDGTYGDPTTQISIEKTLPQLKFFLHQLKENQKFAMTFVGGEPLLHPHAVKAIYDYVQNAAFERNIKTSFTLVTNGTLIENETLDLLRSMQIHLIVSLDGPSQINDLVRPSKNNTSSTEMTTKGLDAIKKNRGQILSLGLSAVSSESNTETFQAYNFLKQFDPNWMEFTFAYSEKSQNVQDKYLTEMSKIAQTAYQSGGEAELRKIKQFDSYFSMLDRQKRLHNHCGAGKTFAMIDAKNKVYTCPWQTGKASEVVGQGEQLEPDKLIKYSKSLIELNDCQTCWARHLCAGGCMYIHEQHTGHKHTKSTLFCSRTRSLILLAFKYYIMSRVSAS